MKGFIKGILLTAVLALPIHGCAGEMLSINELANHAEENLKDELGINSFTESAKESIMENITSDAFRENFRYEQVLIDAQTCELQAGWIAEDDGLYHKEPITWDDL